jgi:hypothetical protein
MTSKKILKTIGTLALTTTMSVACLCGLKTTNSASADNDILKNALEFPNVTCSSFNTGSVYSTNDITGWSRIRKTTSATTMVIDVTNTNYFTNTFYIPNMTVGQKGTDNKVLMINSANKNNKPSDESYTPSEVREGYKSDELTMDANSYYILQVSYLTKDLGNKEGSHFASVYLSGLEDEEGNEIKLKYEQISSNSWDTAYFFVSTGDLAQTVNLELWLGTEKYDSHGVAFFDEVHLQKCSENLFYETFYDEHRNDDTFYYNIKKTNTDSNGETYLSYGENESYMNQDKDLVTLCELDEEVNIMTDKNLNFEKDFSDKLDTLVDWKVAEGKTGKANAQVVNINSENSFKLATKNAYAYPGTNFTHNNNNALVLWTDAGKTGHIALTTEDIEIKANETLKFTALVKTSELKSGAFELVVKENDTIFSNFPYLKETTYVPMSQTATVSTNSKDKFTNGYTEVSIVVQGHDLYNSSLNLYLSLGNATTPAEGCVVVDNVKIEKISVEEYNDGNNQLKLAYGSTPSQILTNSFFNLANAEGKEVSYPLTAQDWTVTKAKKDGLYSGVVNMYDAYFTSFKNANTWAKNLSNPAKDKTVPNNAFLFNNAQKSYQSIKSAEFSLSKGSYYNLTLDYITFKTDPSSQNNANLTIDVYTNEDVLIYTDTISSAANWSTYNGYIYAGESSISGYVVLSFGKAGNECQGQAYIDKIKIESTDAEAFNNAVKKADLSNFMLNLDPTNSINNSITASLAYKGVSSLAYAGNGGIIAGKDNDAYGYKGHDSIDDGSLKNNVLVIETYQPTTFTMTSNFNINLEASKYYKLTFRVLTSLPDKNAEAKEEDNNYGVSVGLDKFDLAQNLVFNEGWTDVTMYFYNGNSEEVETKFTFALKSLTQDNTGWAYLTDLVWTEATDENTIEADYTAAKDSEDYGKTVFALSYENKEGDTDKEEETDTTTDEKKGVDIFTILIGISSGITGIAVVLAVIAYFLRKIRIKKVEKVRTAKYDRSATIDNSIIVSEANRIKKEKQEEIENAIETYKAQMQELENKQKENIALSRKQNGNITKEIEREFKSYASKRNKLQEKLNILNENLENINSPEYMISLQRKITTQRAKAKKEALKQAKNAEKKSK